MPNTHMPTWYSRAVAAIKRDPKKTTVLVVLMVLMGLMWIRTLSGPQKPAAASAAGTSAAPRSGRTGTGKVAAPNASASQRSMGINPKLQKWAEGPVAPISRNLFAVKLDYFPVESPKNGGAVREQRDDRFWARLEKSLTLQADQRGKRENQIANYKAQAAQLKLQSTTMGGSVPKAMLNGELVGEGDVVASFRVLKIEARRVIVEREGIRLEIQMK